FVLEYAILGFAFVAESVSFTRALRQTRRDQRAAGLTFRRYVRETREPTSKTVLSEDLADLAGLALATGGIALHQATGAVAWDAAASIAIGALLAYVGLSLARDFRGFLLGQSARPEERELILEALRRHPAVQDVVDVRTVVLGPDALFVVTRIDFDDALDAAALEDAADELEDAVRAAVPDVREVFVDPTRGR